MRVSLSAAIAESGAATTSASRTAQRIFIALDSLSCGTGAQQLVADQRQNGLAVLVHRGVLYLHDAAVRFRRRASRLEHLRDDVERVARTHRLEPAQLVDARRADAAVREHARLPEEAERERRGVKAARDQSAEHALRGGGDVDVEGLGIELQREVDDLRFE